MGEAELRAFTRYLSECHQDNPNGGEEHGCVAAYTSYSIEFGSPRGAMRPLDDLMSARSSRQVYAQAGLEKGPIDVDSVLQESAIIIKLERGASARFRALRAGSVARGNQ
jgi:hypothetical protein